MGWQRRMTANAGPLSASGEASNGNPVQVEMYINGSWVDITSYVMVRDNSGNISITRGRRDEGSTSEQATCQLTLNNRDGRWSPRYPGGAYFGLIGRNQPIRVSVPNGLGGKSYRFQGEVSSWPQMWDPTGTDIWTEIEASGVLRRLAQGPAPATSSIYRGLTSPLPTGIRAYWPMEDATGSTSFASALPGGYAMTYTGNPEFASYSNFPASDPVETLNENELTGRVLGYADPTATQVRFLCYIPPDGLLDLTNLCVINAEDYLSGKARRYELWYSTVTNSLSIGAANGDGSFVGVQLDGTYDIRGKRLYISIELAESGSDLTRAIRIYDLENGATSSVSDTMLNTAVSRVISVQFGTESVFTVNPEGLSAVAIAHVTVEDTITPMATLGVTLNPVGETAGSRIQRLCAENGIAFEAIGTLSDSVAMGGQDKSNPLSLMQEAELADGGLLYESTATLGLGYRTRVSLCNQDAAFTLDYSGFNLSEVPTPVEDDRYIQNQVTVTVNGVTSSYSLTSGSLSTLPPPAGVGVYGTDVTLNLNSTEEGASHAAWRVFLGTVDEPRYPQISVNLAHSTFTSNPALKQAVLGLRQGDRILVSNLPFWLPPGNIDQLILGFEETLTHFEHRITFNCAPASPYRVGSLDALEVRADTDGSELLTAVTTSSTSLTVIPSSGKNTLWTTDSAQMPFDIRSQSEVMTVSAIASAYSDTFTRTLSSTWGTMNTGQSWQVFGDTSGTDFSVGSGYGVHKLSTVDASRRSALDYTYSDVHVLVNVTTSATATGDSLFGGPAIRYIDSSNLYHVRLEFTTANAIILAINKRYDVSSSTLASYTTTITHVPGTFVRVRAMALGNMLYAKVWPVSGVEPDWQIITTDSSLPSALFVGCRSITGPSSTNVSPQVRYDAFELVNQQVFTVTRSVNGISQTHAAGADIRLNNPTIVSL
jgi:hypothetical protein